VNVGPLAIKKSKPRKILVMVAHMKKPIWERPNPKAKSKKLTTSQKAKAKASAKAAGRPYPNLVDALRVINKK
jgi:hypothetical protein